MIKNKIVTGFLSFFCFNVFVGLVLPSAWAGEATKIPEFKTRREKIEWYYNEVSYDKMDLLDQFYAENISFRDPVHQVNGLAPFKAYTKGMYEGVLSIKFEFSQHIEQGDDVASFWVMKFKTKALEDGAEISVPGMSRFRFDAQGKVSDQEDIFDMGAMVYEHVNFVGFLVRKIKERLKN